MSGTSAMTGLRGSGPVRAVLGTMNFGQRTNERASVDVIRRALERGVVSFDTANIYCEGASERILGKALGRDRERVEVATKVGAWKKEGLSPARVKASIDESLERLGMEYVDVYYLHVPDHGTPIRETLAGVKEVVATGKARAWGVSNYASWQILEMIHVAREIDLAPPVIAQQLYNLVHRELDVEFFAFKKAYPMHLTVYNALAGGLLTGRHEHESGAPAKGSRLDANPLYRRRYVSSGMFERAAALKAIATDHGMSLVELAYAFLASRRDIDSVLIGPADVAQLDAALDGLARELAPEAKKAIEELHRAWTATDTHYVR